MMSRAVCYPWLFGCWWWWFGSPGCPLIWSLLFHFCLQAGERCYLMKEVLNFTLEEVLLPQSHRFRPYMQEVVPFLAKLSNRLSQCVSSSPSLTPPSLTCLPSPLLPLRTLLCPAPFRAGSKRCLSNTITRVTWNHYFNWVTFWIYGDEGGLKDKSTEGSFVPGKKQLRLCEMTKALGTVRENA